MHTTRLLKVAAVSSAAADARRCVWRLTRLSPALPRAARRQRPRPRPHRAARPTPVRSATARAQVNILAWPGYAEDGSTDPTVDWVTPFEKATGCKVNVKTSAPPTRW